MSMITSQPIRTGRYSTEARPCERYCTRIVPNSGPITVGNFLSPGSSAVGPYLEISSVKSASVMNTNTGWDFD